MRNIKNLKKLRRHIAKKSTEFDMMNITLCIMGHARELFTGGMFSGSLASETVANTLGITTDEAAHVAFGWSGKTKPNRERSLAMIDRMIEGKVINWRYTTPHYTER